MHWTLYRGDNPAKMDTITELITVRGDMYVVVITALDVTERVF